jgi:hypothetical protein
VLQGGKGDHPVKAESGSFEKLLAQLFWNPCL